MDYKKIWDKSYENKDNYLFYPNEEVIRFLNKYIERRTNLNIKNKNKVFFRYWVWFWSTYEIYS